MAADDGAPRTRLSTKGQIVVPKDVRERHNWAPGDELVIEETADGVLLKRATALPPTRIEDVAGCLHRPGMRPRTIKEMNDAITREVRRRHARGRY